MDRKALKTNRKQLENLSREELNTFAGWFGLTTDAESYADKASLISAILAENARARNSQEPTSNTTCGVFDLASPERRRYIDIKFQEGPISENGINGCFDEDVMEILLERLRGFQDGPLRCRETALVITALEEAQHWQLRRKHNRTKSGVEGTYLPHST